MSSDLIRLTAAQIAEAVATGEASAVDVTRAHLDRIFRKAKRVCYRRAMDEWNLGDVPDHHSFIQFAPIGDDATCLHRLSGAALDLQLLSNDTVRLRESLIGVSSGDWNPRREIRLEVIVHIRRPARKRAGQIDDGG